MSFKAKRRINKPQNDEPMSVLEKYGIKLSTHTEIKDQPRRSVKDPCHACLRENRFSEVTHFCKDCREKLCQNCVQQHRKFQILQTHKILSNAELAAKEKHKQQIAEKLKLDAKCDFHFGKLLDLYCPSHDRVGCKVCMAVSHKTCKPAEHIVKIVSGFAKSESLINTKQRLEKLRKDLITLRGKRRDDKVTLGKDKDTVLKKINDLRIQINDTFDKLEAAAKEILNRKFTEDMATIKNDIKKCEEMNIAIDGTLAKFNNVSEPQLFVHVKYGARACFSEGEKVKTAVENNVLQERIEFTVDEDIPIWLKGLHALGKFDHEQNVYGGAYLTKSDLSLKSDSCQDKYVFNGSVNMADGHTVIADWNNRRLKLLNHSYKVIAHCDLPGVPYAVCSVSSREVAVSLRDEKTIQFVSLDPEGKMEMKKRFKIGEYCRGLACYNKEVYVACGGGEGEVNGQLRVYSKSGVLIRTYEEDKQLKPIFTSPKDVVLNNGGTRIYITDRKRGVITLSKSGRVLSVFTDPDLKTPFGLCINGRGDLFVSGYDSENVIQIGPDGKKICEVLKSPDGISKPLSISCHESLSSRLLITMEHSSLLKVFSLVF